jgi:hypothetical protein
MEIGRLESVAIREVWGHEALDFTPWLLANADVLAEALGIELELEAAEHGVGGFSLDLVGRDLTHGCALIVENQIEGTDHSHLGQLLTYAGGVAEVGTVVWIASAFRDEHRQALDWLNEHTSEEVRFFGVVLRAVRIADSPPAPLLEVVANPNDWQKRVRATTARPAGEREEAYAQFWAALLDELRTRSPGLVGSRTKVPSSNYLPFSADVPNAAVYAVFGQGHVRVELYIDAQNADRNREIFDALQVHRAAIEARFGGPIEFDPAEGRQICKLLVKREAPNAAVLVPERHDELRAWFADTLTRFLPAFRSDGDSTSGISAWLSGA